MKILSSAIASNNCLCSESITENGVHYGVEVYGKIFDNLSRLGLSPENWVKDFTSLSNEFVAEVIEEF